MSASLSDLLTAAKNIVLALGTATQTYLDVNGVQTICGLASATLVRLGSGRVCRVSVVVGGSAAGVIYDAATASATTKPLYHIPNTEGVYEVNLPVTNGIVVAPGSGQTVSVSFS